MIVESVQCNRDWGLTRRSTHIFPVRLDGPGGSSGKENENLRVQLDGIQATLDEASLCTINAIDDPIPAMQLLLNEARSAIPKKDYGDDSGFDGTEGVGAIASLEAIAFLAFELESAVDFPDCDLADNYPGNFVSRALSAAFTVHDRFLHPDFHVIYDGPARVGVINPL